MDLNFAKTFNLNVKSKIASCSNFLKVCLPKGFHKTTKGRLNQIGCKSLGRSLRPSQVQVDYNSNSSLANKYDSPKLSLVKKYSSKQSEHFG